MAYPNIYGRRPAEFASKSSHSSIIKDPTVRDFLQNCRLPTEKDQIISADLQKNLYNLNDLTQEFNPIKFVLAFDGGYNRATIKRAFPSATLVLFKFGALLLRLDDLKEISRQPFVNPKTIAQIKSADTWNLSLPVSGLTYKNQSSLLDSVRHGLDEFFSRPLRPDDDSSLKTTLKWLLYQDYDRPKNNIRIKSCPNDDCGAYDIKLDRTDNNECSGCQERLLLIDSLLLHENVDEHQGAGSVVPHIAGIIEQLLLIHHLKFFSEKRPNLLNRILFLKDGPLAFFGSSRFHEPTRRLLNFLQKQQTLAIAGLEKSGHFVDHGLAISQTSGARLKPNQVLLLSNDYISKYIVANRPHKERAFGALNYYGAKVIFRDINSKTYVVNLPVESKDSVRSLSLHHLPNLGNILPVISELKSEMYDNSLLPIALINRAVSLAHRPSSAILSKFAKEGISS